MTAVERVWTESGLCSQDMELPFDYNADDTSS
jgi:hypothetical protein